MVDVRECSWLMISAYRELPALLDEYAQESAIAGLPAAKPDEMSYLRLERSGAITILAATLDGALVGFITVLVTPNPHYGGAKIGVSESFFVGKAHRKSGAGQLLRKKAEEIAERKGGAGLLISAPLGGKLARVLEADRNYRETNRVFFRSFA